MSKPSHQLRALADYGLFDMPYEDRQRRGWTAQQLLSDGGLQTRTRLLANTQERKGRKVPGYPRVATPRPKALPWWAALASSIGRLGRVQLAATKPHIRCGPVMVQVFDHEGKEVRNQ